MNTFKRTLTQRIAHAKLVANSDASSQHAKDAARAWLASKGV